MRRLLATAFAVTGMLVLLAALPLAAQETEPAPPAPPVAFPPQAARPADAPRSAEAFQPRVDVSGYYTHGGYSTGGSSDSQAVYLQFYLDRDSKIWIGHNHIRYSDTQAFVNGTRQDIDNLGAYVAIGSKNAIQADYFSVGTSPGGHGNVAGLEVFHVFSPAVSAGLGGVVSQYPGVRAWQVAPRVVAWPSPSLSLQSRAVITGASGAGGNTRLALLEKVTWYVSPEWSVRFGGIVGSAWYLVDNDTSALYTQAQPLTGSFFAGVRFQPSKNAVLTVHYERAYFQGYSVQYVLGGASIRF